jgi:hypothetical protein
MHFAGAFKIPSITLLGNHYESASLHRKQWGYPESVVLGKETNIGESKIPDVEEVLTEVETMIKNKRLN